MHPRPIFADPSGRRRRLMFRMGIAAAVALAACLGAVVVAIAGGPQAPFTQWAVPGSGAASGANKAAGHRIATPSPTATRAGASAGIAAPITNRGGHAPAGLARSPNPHKSSHGA
ncbi:MAG: hypothetical protein J2P28_15265 [Actinobacteria bacterium]|nr:hypothetical protein [Actinomycetota bacterium]